MDENKHVTVCIPTRDRGASVALTIQSLKALTYDNFDVVIVDQSTDSRTREAVHDAVGNDSRFQYVHCGRPGLSVARNVALEYATGGIIAFTDDDCEVSADWLDRAIWYFQEEQDVGLICGEVREGPHDWTKGYIPSFYVAKRTKISSPWVKWRARGIGANMIFRWDVLRRVGPFDEVLGAGGPLYSCEDGDMTYRVLKHGYSVLNVSDAFVIHHGFRTWQEGKEVMRKALLSVGATCMKHLRMGDPAIVPTLFYIWFGRCVAWGNLIRLRRNPGIGRFLAYGAGLIVSFRYRIDHRSGVYRVPKSLTSTAISAPESVSATAD